MIHGHRRKVRYGIDLAWDPILVDLGSIAPANARIELMP